MVQKFIIAVAFLLLFWVNPMNSFAEDLLDKARNDFYKATKDESALESSLIMFEQLEKKPEYKAVAQTYIGSLIMLKGKYAFWPKQKLQYVNDGLEEMDKGLALDPDNIESLFIYGSTCYYLPFFLGKKTLAVEKLRKLVQVLDDESVNKVDEKILKNALEFIKDKINLSDAEEKKVNFRLGKL